MVAGKIPSLELIQIASPCTANWEAMIGDDRARHCGECNLTVYNISAMTREEAVAFISEREGRTCIRMFKRPDGTVLTRDCPVGVAGVRAKFVRLVLATAGVLIAFAFTALTALGKVPLVRDYVAFGKLERLRDTYDPPMIMGAMCPPAPPVPPAPGGTAAPPPVIPSIEPESPL